MYSMVLVAECACGTKFWLGIIVLELYAKNVPNILLIYKNDHTIYREESM